MSAPARRPDASMDLLATIQRTAVDPDYARARQDGPRRAPLARLAAVGLAATLLAMAAAQTSRSAPDAQRERSELIERVQKAEQRQDELAAQVQARAAEVDRLRSVQLEGERAGDRRLAARAGAAAVTGPGIVVAVDDAPSTARNSSAGLVTDRDLRRLVNGLWQAGAEAVAINGHRITTRTAIRAAGSAITVDYRSLGHPYQVEAIGDPRQLGSGLAASPAGQWWSFLKDNYSISYQVTTADELSLAADPGLRLDVARPSP